MILRIGARYQVCDCWKLLSVPPNIPLIGGETYSLQRVGQAFYNHFGLRPMIFGDNHPTITALLLEEDENRAITMINDLVKKMEKYNLGEIMVGHITISDKIYLHWQRLWRVTQE